MLYHEETLVQLQHQFRRRLLALCIPAVSLLLIVFAGFFSRQKWLCLFASLALGVTLIAGWDLWLRPVHNYIRFVQELLHGITHHVEGTFSSIGDKTVPVDGVECYPLHLISMDSKNQPFDRLLYWDAQLPKPQWKKGEPLRVTFHDHAIAEVLSLDPSGAVS